MIMGNFNNKYPTIDPATWTIQRAKQNIDSRFQGWRWESMTEEQCQIYLNFIKTGIEKYYKIKNR